LLFSTLVFCLAFRTCKCTYIKHDCLAPRFRQLKSPSPEPSTMGSASSKIARTPAVKSGKKPSWSGARMPPHGTKTSPAKAQQPWASEFKDEGMHCTILHSQQTLTTTVEIQRDAKDPQLLANLSRLKPVNVHHHQHKLPTGTVRFEFVTLTTYRLGVTLMGYFLLLFLLGKGRKIMLGNFLNRGRGRNRILIARAHHITAFTSRRSSSFSRSVRVWTWWLIVLKALW
jgi:hypothetical protein